MSIRLIVLEDDDDDFKLLTAALEDDRGDPEIELLGRVTTAAELIASLKHEPDALLLDHHVPVSGASERTIPQAVILVSEITKQRGWDRPIRVLWSAALEQDPLAVYSFMAYGGHNFVDKNPQRRNPGFSRGRAALDVIRASCGGARWTWQQDELSAEKDRRLVSRHLDLIAMLETGANTSTIAEKIDMDLDNVDQQTRSIALALGLTRDGGDYRVTVPQAAVRAGYYYVPYKYWHAAPADLKLWPGQRKRGPRRGASADSVSTH